MRETYDFLTSETKDTLTDNVKAAAGGWGKSDRYVYKILAEEAPDLFAPFSVFAEGIARGGVTLREYIQRLEYLEHRFVSKSTARDAGEAITDNFQGYSQFFAEFMQRIQDGLDLKETNDLLDIIPILEKQLAASKESLLANKAKREREAGK